MIIDVVKNRRKVTAQRTGEDKEAINSFDSDIENLITWRNKTLPHIDADFTDQGGED